MSNNSPDYDPNDDSDTRDGAMPDGIGDHEPAMEDETASDEILEIGIPINEVLILPPDDSPDTGDAVTGLKTGLDVEEAAPEPEVSPEDSGGLPVPEGSLPTPSSDPFHALQLQMEEMRQAFDVKLKYDAHKNKIIDDLHQSLQQHRDGLLKKYLHRIVMDVIKIVDDMRKLAVHYNQQPHSAETSVKLVKYIENIASDLEDMFSWEGVMPFTCEGDTVDPARQRIVGKVETHDPQKDKTIAERLRPGYEWDGKVIRPEMVSVYVYQPNSSSGE